MVPCGGTTYTVFCDVLFDNLCWFRTYSLLLLFFYLNNIGSVALLFLVYIHLVLESLSRTVRGIGPASLVLHVFLVLLQKQISNRPMESSKFNTCIFIWVCTHTHIYIYMYIYTVHTRSCVTIPKKHKWDQLSTSLGSISARFDITRICSCKCTEGEARYRPVNQVPKTCGPPCESIAFNRLHQSTLLDSECCSSCRKRRFAFYSSHKVLDVGSSASCKK